jgi:hypothetical protein
MRSRVMPWAVGIAAALALSALGGEAAWAARPEQPTFHKNGAAITARTNVSGHTRVTRIWARGLGLVITCSQGTNSAGLETKGRGTAVEFLYTGCKLAEARESAGRQIEENATLTHCTVKGGGGGAGEIKATGLRSRLVWANGENTLLDLYDSATQPFMELVVEGAECADHGEYTVEGSWLTIPSRTNEEAVMGAQLMEAKDEAGGVVPLYSSWEVKEGAGPRETGTAELAMFFGASKQPLVFEGVQKLELATSGGRRGVFSAHE